MRGEEGSRTLIQHWVMEIPPRARRRVQSVGAFRNGAGNTSACAEKSFHGAGVTWACRKYLRVRGEERPLANSGQSQGEIPPRARRRGLSPRPLRCGKGNTSACAEKSAAHSVRALKHWKYLRVRGEESFLPMRPLIMEEIPPRARKRVGAATMVHSGAGNTSACAEKREYYQEQGGEFRKYLRVRGEEQTHPEVFSASKEIPPRARRRDLHVIGVVLGEGNTSACAEKRDGEIRFFEAQRKYLRVRGEEPTYLGFVTDNPEIPPRARRRGGAFRCGVGLTGNTSACAEKRGCSGHTRWPYRKYLRVRGEEHQRTSRSMP